MHEIAIKSLPLYKKRGLTSLSLYKTARFGRMYMAFWQCVPV